MATNYRSGYNFEKRCEKKFLDNGFTVVSSRGSHSVIDFVALKESTVILIQCKHTSKMVDLGQLFKDENVNLLKDVPVQGLKLLVVKDGTQRQPRVYKYYNDNNIESYQGQWKETDILKGIL